MFTFSWVHSHSLTNASHSVRSSPISGGGGPSALKEGGCYTKALALGSPLWLLYSKYAIWTSFLDAEAMFSTIAELRTWKGGQIAWEAFSWSDSGHGLESRHGSDHLIQHLQQRLVIWMKWSTNSKVPVNVRGWKYNDKIKRKTVWSNSTKALTNLSTMY